VKERRTFCEEPDDPAKEVWIINDTSGKRFPLARTGGTGRLWFGDVEFEYGDWTRLEVVW
jgi:hypothetical protein